MQFELFVINAKGEKIPVRMKQMTEEDAKTTIAEPFWQTDWTSDYIAKSAFDLYSLKTEENELVALGAYEVSKEYIAVYIIYMYHIYGKRSAKQSDNHQASEIQRNRQGNGCFWNKSVGRCRVQR